MGTENSGAGWEPTKDVELALRIGDNLDSLPAGRPATASQIAEALHGADYTLEQVVEVYWICQELRQARILIPGRDGYGYQLDMPAPSRSDIPSGDEPVKPAKSAKCAKPSSPLGGVEDIKGFYGRGTALSAKDLPALKARLEAQGWVVTRRGNKLSCEPPRCRRVCRK